MPAHNTMLSSVARALGVNLPLQNRAIDPLTAMPDLGVTERDTRDMAAYGDLVVAPLGHERCLRVVLYSAKKRS